MTLHPDIITVDDPDEIGHVLEVMALYTQRRRGWINVEPDVAPDAAPSNRSPLTNFFRRHGPEIARGTWIPPAYDLPEAPQSLGLEHDLGTRIVPLLAEWGLPLGEGWHRDQDSPRRGLIATAPQIASHEAILRWLLAVTEATSRRKTAGTWTLHAYEGRAT